MDASTSALSIILNQMFDTYTRFIRVELNKRNFMEKNHRESLEQSKKPVGFFNSLFVKNVDSEYERISKKALDSQNNLLVILNHRLRICDMYRNGYLSMFEEYILNTPDKTPMEIAQDFFENPVLSGATNDLIYYFTFGSAEFLNTTESEAFLIMVISYFEVMEDYNNGVYNYLPITKNPEELYSYNTWILNHHKSYHSDAEVLEILKKDFSLTSNT